MVSLFCISASVGAMMIYGGIHRGFGILFVEFRKTYDSSSANMSVVVSIQIAVMSVSGKKLWGSKLMHLMILIKIFLSPKSESTPSGLVTGFRFICEANFLL
jgi:hypothetical protein